MTVSPDLLIGLRKQFVNKVSPTSEEDNKADEIPGPSSFINTSIDVLRREYRKLPPSLRNVWDRVIFALIFAGLFGLVLYGGAVTVSMFIILIQLKCYHEIITIAFRKYEIRDIYQIKYISLHFLITVNFYISCEHISNYFRPFLRGSVALESVLSYYRFISFCLYFIGIIWFVLSLKKKCYRKQFALLAWIHIIILAIVVQSQFPVKLVFHGMIWFITSILSVVSNDIMAYICGKIFGKTPLIKLSPKKTWEGFIGGAICSITITCSLSYIMCGYEYFVCPIQYKLIDDAIVNVNSCTPDRLFQLINYTMFGLNINMYPFLIHAFYLSLFGSLMAPFGGFFASGFKRAFKVKDFADTIPGHGGVTDRMDCLLIMLTFAHVYVTSFILSSNAPDSNTNSIFNNILNMKIEEQLKLYYMFKDNLVTSGYEL